MKIPLSKAYVDARMKHKVLEVIDSGQFILGRECSEFEREFADFTGTDYAILTSSGTSALFLSLRALGIKDGDEILVPSLTAFPTIEAILHVGARPVFVDIDKTTYLMSVDHIESLVSLHKAIKGIIPVHLYGNPVDMGPILDLAKHHNLSIIEDCCQAHGAAYHGNIVGTMGNAGCFSFYPSKNMTVFGDGGMIVTSDEKVTQTCRMLRDHGRTTKYEHELVGYNLRFNEVQAAVGRMQLEHLNSFNANRRMIAKWYDEGLSELPVITPKTAENCIPVYHLYVIQSEKRDELSDFLRKKGIQTGIHYPIPNHQQPAVTNLMGVQRSLPNTEEAVKRILSLPMHPQLTRKEVNYVCESIREFYATKKS